ncbi:MAG: helix-turn-helix transcriptional regulator [Clostridia bacterium]|nr:helix-turn-helix transcriptional regulator [Clostridia bacterium]
MLGENIKNIRKSKGLSQEDLAIRLNVVRQTVSKWETGVSQT